MNYKGNAFATGLIIGAVVLFLVLMVVEATTGADFVGNVFKAIKGWGAK